MGDRVGAVEGLAMTPALPSAHFWRGRRVLLTGHTGFKGGWMALWLTQLGAHVTGFARAPEREPSLYHLAEIEQKIALSLMGDLRDETSVADAVRRARPHIIMHLAAQPIVRRAIAEPVDTIATNVLGTAHLLDAARALEGLECILIVTSDKVYANDEHGRAFTEHDALGGKDAYSASKAATELITHAFAKSYYEPRGIPVATARGGNVIGGGDFAEDRIIPDIMRAINRRERIDLRMPQATRPWQHVLDCISGYLLFAQALVQDPETPRALNFGPAPGKGITVAALTDAMLDALGAKIERGRASPSESVEMQALAIDSSLARQALSWRDRLAGQDLVQWTADWYRAIANGASPCETTLAQISAYERLSR